MQDNLAPRVTRLTCTGHRLAFGGRHGCGHLRALPCRTKGLTAVLRSGALLNNAVQVVHMCHQQSGWLVGRFARGIGFVLQYLWSFLAAGDSLAPRMMRTGWDKEQTTSTAASGDQSEFGRRFATIFIHLEFDAASTNKHDEMHCATVGWSGPCLKSPFRRTNDERALANQYISLTNPNHRPAPLQLFHPLLRPP